MSQTLTGCLPVWLRGLRLGHVVVICVLGGAVAALLPDVGLPLPNLQSAGIAMVPIASVIALVVANASLKLLMDANSPVLAVTRRPSLIMLAGASILVPTLILAAVWMVGAGPRAESVTYLRGVVGFLALGILGWRVFGRALGSALPLVSVIVMGLAGRDSETLRASWWAWALTADATSTYWLLPIVLAAIAALWLPTLPEVDLRRGYRST